MFKKLKRLFVVEDGKASPKSTASKEQPVEEEDDFVTPVATEAVVGAVDASPSPEMKSKFLDVLMSAMDKNDLDGFDYLEYKQSLQNLTKIEPDEEKRFKTAYAMAQAMNATPAHLVDTAKHYVNVLKKEESKFQNALANQKNKQISDKQAQLKQLEMQIAEKDKQIAQMQADIEKHKKQHAQMKDNLSNAAGKLERTKKSFLLSYETLVSQINGDIEKMTKYLK